MGADPPSAVARKSGRALQCDPESIGAVAAPTSPRALGQLALKCNQVEGQLPSQNPEPMRIGQEAIENLQVTTKETSTARFALGNAMAALIMGPQSQFRFRPGLFSSKGEVNRFDFWIEFGKFRWAATPKWADETPKTVLGWAPHQVHIETPSAKIDLYGTDVYLTVDPTTKATTVYVAEGSAAVTGAGQKIMVNAGELTFVSLDTPPLPATPFDPATQSLSSQAGGPAFRSPAELLDDPFLDLRDPRFDLPK
jgi:hypothetical protein